MMYRKTALVIASPWNEGIDMEGVSVSDTDRDNGSPKKGDWVACQPHDTNDRWLIGAETFAKTYECAESTVQQTYEDLMDRDANTADVHMELALSVEETKELFRKVMEEDEFEELFFDADGVPEDDEVVEIIICNKLKETLVEKFGKGGMRMSLYGINMSVHMRDNVWLPLKNVCLEYITKEEGERRRESGSRWAA